MYGLFSFSKRIGDWRKGNGEESRLCEVLVAGLIQMAGVAVRAAAHQTCRADHQAATLQRRDSQSRMQLSDNENKRMRSKQIMGETEVV